MRKYLRVFSYAARDQIIYLPAFLVRNIFFAVIMFTFWSLWRVVYAGREAVAGLTLVQTVWYLTFTETVELSKCRALFQIQEEVKDGTLTVSLSRPYSYAMYYFSRAMGESIVKIVPMLVEGFIVAILLAGPLPGYLEALPFGIVLIVCGLMVTNLWILAIALLSFWVEEVMPFYWVIQKLIFILGGLFLPINMFPHWLAGIARVLPFAFSAYWPAYTMVHFSAATFASGLAGSAAYVALLGATVFLLFSAGKRRVHAQGG